jgi:hypothetical protein
MLKELPMNEKKLFDVVLACDKFRSYIIGSEVEVHTDHQGLTEIITRKSSFTVIGTEPRFRPVPSHLNFCDRWFKKLITSAMLSWSWKCPTGRSILDSHVSKKNRLLVFFFFWGVVSQPKVKDLFLSTREPPSPPSSFERSTAAACPYHRH